MIRIYADAPCCSPPAHGLRPVQLGNYERRERVYTLSGPNGASGVRLESSTR